MQAAVMRDATLVVDEIAELVPGPGQLLVRTLACGICGSDLHTLHHGDQFIEMSKGGADGLGPGIPAPEIMDLDRDVVMGHEFSAEVLEVGENVGNCRPGDIVVSVPITLDAAGMHPIGFSNVYPGGYAEQMILSDLLALKVPDGVDPRHAALTEPMAVGLHAVNLSGIAPGDAAVVLGCGPVGLAVVAALRLVGVESIVATDLSPTRRGLATTMGAHEVTDPRTEPAVDAWRRVDGRRTLVIFEAVGVPGMIDDAMRAAPRGSQIVVVGVCMETDHIRPMRGVIKELRIQFAFGYDPLEFKTTLDRIADGHLDVAPLITGSVPIAGIAQAFIDLGDPEAHAKILVEPSRS